MMNAAVLRTLGSAPRFESFAEPDVRPGEALVTVRAASVKQLDRLIAKGAHYSSPTPDRLPMVCGTDGIGLLDDGTRVYFATLRAPFGALAERSVASWHVPLPAAVDDATAAALINPALGAWLPLAWRGRMTAGENVLVLGATGVTGRLAVTIARILGAGRVVAAGRNRTILESLKSLGADAVVDTDQPVEQLTEAFVAAAGPKGFDVIVDYLWGKPAEALIGALTGHDLSVAATGAGRGVRFVSVGEMAGAGITLPSAVLRSSHLSILGSGTGNFPPPAEMKATVARILDEAAAGSLGIDTETLPLSEVEQAWDNPAMAERRMVLVP